MPLEKEKEKHHLLPHLALSAVLQSFHLLLTVLHFDSKENVVRAITLLWQGRKGQEETERFTGNQGSSKEKVLPKCNRKEQWSSIGVKKTIGYR